MAVGDQTLTIYRSTSTSVCLLFERLHEFESLHQLLKERSSTCDTQWPIFSLDWQHCDVRKEPKTKPNGVWHSRLMSDISYISVTAHRQRRSVTHRRLIEWFTCRVTGSEWQTTSQMVSWIAARWLTGRLAGCYFSFLSPSITGLIAEGWPVSQTGSTFFFFCFICIRHQRETFRVTLCQ